MTLHPKPDDDQHEAYVMAADRGAEQQLLRDISDLLSKRFQDRQLLRPGPDVEAEVRQVIDTAVENFRRQAAIRGTRGLVDSDGVKRRLADRQLGMGYLAPLMANPRHEEIIVNGSRVWVISGGQKRLLEHLLPDEDETANLVKRVIGPMGARLDESSPEVEVGLPDGSRLTAVIPPMTDVVRVNIRKFVLRAQRLETLVTLGTLPQDAMTFLDAAVRAGVNMLVSGATGSGKTTLINCLGGAIASEQERVVSIEDTAELTLFKTLPDCVPLYGRAPNVEGSGGITYRKLMRSALRLRPTRIVVGEVRGPEALDMLVAMATGHQGSMGSLHAESPRGALDQLATFAQMAEEHLTREALVQMIARTIELVVQVQIDPDTGDRRVVHIFEVTGRGEGPVVEGQDLWMLEDTVQDGGGSARLSWTGMRPRCLKKMEQRGVGYQLPPVPFGRVRYEQVTGEALLSGGAR
jgi:pilus assembly protein CpaF